MPLACPVHHTPQVLSLGSGWGRGLPPAICPSPGQASPIAATLGLRAGRGHTWVWAQFQAHVCPSNPSTQKGLRGTAGSENLCASPCCSRTFGWGRGPSGHPLNSQPPLCSSACQARPKSTSEPPDRHWPCAAGSGLGPAYLSRGTQPLGRHRGSGPGCHGTGTWRLEGGRDRDSDTHTHTCAHTHTPCGTAPGPSSCSRAGDAGAHSPAQPRSPPALLTKPRSSLLAA